VRFQVLLYNCDPFALGSLIPDDGGRTYLWNVGRQSFYTAVHPRRQFWTSYIPVFLLSISVLSYLPQVHVLHVLPTQSSLIFSSVNQLIAISLRTIPAVSLPWVFWSSYVVVGWLAILLRIRVHISDRKPVILTEAFRGFPQFSR
jgi:hypothetical protein